MLPNDLIYNFVAVRLIIDTGVVQKGLNQGKASVAFASLRCGNIVIYSKNSVFLIRNRFHTF